MEKGKGWSMGGPTSVALPLAVPARSASTQQRKTVTLYLPQCTDAVSHPMFVGFGNGLFTINKRTFYRRSQDLEDKCRLGAEKRTTVKGRHEGNWLRVEIDEAELEAAGTDVAAARGAQIGAASAATTVTI